MRGADARRGRLGVKTVEARGVRAGVTMFVAGQRQLIDVRVGPFNGGSEHLDKSQPDGLWAPYHHWGGGTGKYKGILAVGAFWLHFNACVVDLGGYTAMDNIRITRRGKIK